MMEENEVSWRAVSAHCPVIASDGCQVGRVLDVAASSQEDIFHGIIFKKDLLDHARLAPADSVDRITDRAVYLKVDSLAADSLDVFHQPMVERLGLRGHFFWKHLGWTDDPS